MTGKTEAEQVRGRGGEIIYRHGTLKMRVTLPKQTPLPVARLGERGGLGEKPQETVSRGRAVGPPCVSQGEGAQEPQGEGSRAEDPLVLGGVQLDMPQATWSPHSLPVSL